MRPLPSWSWILLCVVLSVPAAAQTPASDDAVIDALLAQNVITWDNAAWLVGHASGAFEDGLPPADAARKALDAGWGRGLEPGSTVTLGVYSQLLVSALHVPAGFFYQLFPGPRYAYRELIFRRLIPGSLSPDAPVSGQDAMLFLQNVQTWKESHR
jgi:hypothetical protein